MNGYHYLARVILAVTVTAAAPAAVVACGGKAVVDSDDGGTGTCSCTCPLGDQCGYYTCGPDCGCLLVPEPEATACSDGYCDGQGTCVTRTAICTRACEIIPGCMGSTDCYPYCFTNLADCSAAEMRDTDLCTTNFLIPMCQAEAWAACVTAIPCLEPQAQPGGPPG